ncbi:MAG: sugar phosphate isomerase/epimerase [Anaerolineae bacterium]|nr:sugar phosphate isomerase/epimerase [Anaerolineae bacterium]
MKTGLVVCGPDVSYGPLALLSGSFEEKVARAAALGYHGVELMVRDPAGLDWDKIKHTLDDAGLEVPQVVTGELYGADGLCLVTADKELHRRALSRTKAVVDLAAYLGAIVNIGRLRGQLSYLGDVQDPWGIAVERLDQVVGYAEECGVRIAIEPINRYETDFVHSAEDGLRLIGDIGRENVGLMLDLFHMNIEDASIEKGLRQAGDRLWHVHIADSNRLHPGAGHTDFSSVFATLRDMAYQGYVSAEILPLPDPDTAARRTIDYLRTYV